MKMKDAFYCHDIFAFSSFLSILSNFLCRQSCLWTKTVLLLPSHSFSCLIALGRTSIIVLKRSGERGLINLSGKSEFLIIEDGMNCRLFVDFFFLIKLGKFPSILSLLRVFIMIGCWILSRFFCIYWNNQVIFFFFSLFLWWIAFTDFGIWSCLAYLGWIHLNWVI